MPYIFQEFQAVTSSLFSGSDYLTLSRLWKKVRDSDPTCDSLAAWHPPTGWTASRNMNHDELPVLRNQNVWISGFRNIIDFVAQYSAGQWTLDAELEGEERADCNAFSAFIESRGQELIDLSLYVSTQNYVDVTRPLYSKIQPFPLQYMTPLSIRRAAKSRTAHLGLSSLDIDSEDNVAQEKSLIPESLRRPRATLSGLLAQPENAARIRLDALARSFLSPLQALRGQKRHFVGQTCTSLDCLALGYLSLALLPDLPGSWLADCMRKNYPQLCGFVHDMQRAIFGGAVTLEGAGLGVQDDRSKAALGRGRLPWATPDRGSLGRTVSSLGSNIADSLPIISSLRENARIRHELVSSTEDKKEQERIAQVSTLRNQELLINIGSVLAGIGLFVGFMFQQGLIAFGESVPAPRKETTTEKSGLAQYGDAGAALDTLMSQMDFEIDMERVGRAHDGSEGEVDVEIIPDRTL